MSASDYQDSISYEVVINEEKQYSIWPNHKDLPAGWGKVGFQGKRAECLDFIEVNWGDMRPASLVRQMSSEP
jgi:MbtH protein